MAKKRKTKDKKHGNEYYNFEIEDWEAEYDFSLNTIFQNFFESIYFENSSLVLLCKMTSPVIKNARNTRIIMRCSKRLDDHWKVSPSKSKVEAIGLMEMPRGDDTLTFFCYIPTYSFQ